MAISSPLALVPRLSPCQHECQIPPRLSLHLPSALETVKGSEAILRGIYYQGKELSPT